MNIPNCYLRDDTNHQNVNHDPNKFQNEPYELSIGVCLLVTEYVQEQLLRRVAGTVDVKNYKSLCQMVYFLF